MVVIGVLVTVGPSTEGLAAEGMPLKVAYEKILTDKSTVALVAAENARLIVVELVTEEMVRNAAAELASPGVPTPFCRCVEEDGKRVYVVGYTNNDGSEVIRDRGNFGPLAESDLHFLECELLARTVLTAALGIDKEG